MLIEFVALITVIAIAIIILGFMSNGNAALLMGGALILILLGIFIGLENIDLQSGITTTLNSTVSGNITTQIELAAFTYTTVDNGLTLLLSIVLMLSGLMISYYSLPTILPRFDDEDE